ncbi:MAG: hypothetical protein J1F39_01800 [Clostridiales bacterium]|nr:hypothetical protein [Clostridiales bacterium]
MIYISSDAFNNPDSPVYYIVGVLFLLLIVGLLAAYLLISKHLEKKKKEKDEGGLTESGENSESTKESSNVTDAMHDDPDSEHNKLE